MALTEQSSVVFSIRALMDTENQRIRAENAEQQAARSEALERQRQALEREGQRVERERKAEHQMGTLANIEQLELQYQQQTERSLSQLRLELEQQYAARTKARAAEAAALIGRQRILSASLATILAGIGLCWLFIISPSQRRATNAYESLSGLYEKSLKEHRQLEETFRLERQQFNERLASLLARGHSNTPASTPLITKPVPPPQRPHVQPSTSPNPPCTCLNGDPLCNCIH